MLFEAKELLKLLTDEEWRLVIPYDADLLEKAALRIQQDLWDKKNAAARCLLSCGLSSRVRGKLTRCN